MSYVELADRFTRSVALSELSGVATEPEAQLTVPIHDFLTAVATEAGLGELTLLREAQLRGVRPDFAALLDGRPCGWVELKAPGRSVDGETWRGREKKQWAELSELDALIVSNGQQAVLYTLGEPIAEATLPNGAAEEWDAAALVKLLQLFTSHRLTTIGRVPELSARLAPLAKLLRERVEVGLSRETLRPPIKEAWQAWKIHVHEGASKDVFANDLAQVISYALAIAALRGDADKNKDQYISLAEAQDALRGPNDVLAAALGPALKVPGLLKELAPEVGALERVVSAVDPKRVARSKDSRGEPWLWFYEDFLAKYDPQARKEAGVYYTPVDVVHTQVRLVDHVLREVFNKPLSFGDPKVTTLDPAAGSGTYPLAVLDHAADVALQQRGPAGPVQVSNTLAKNLIAFELMPGPYAVAHLRIGQRLAELAGTLTPPEHVRVYLTDTLDDPEAEVPMLGLWGDPAVLAEERARASEVKSTEPVTAIIGNPPYARRTAESGGGWVVHAPNGRSLFDDLRDAARRHGVIFSAIRSLYDDYVYFWRWALWKAFEQDKSKPAVISFITSSSWLRGPAFVGLRELVRELADEMWIVDLGGGSRGAVKDDNLFAIQTAVAIVTVYRKGKARKTPARVYYQRLRGSANDKSIGLQDLQPPAQQPDAWQLMEPDLSAKLIPSSEDNKWLSYPALTDLLPWQQPGAVYARSWPVAPSPDTLKQRWQTFLSAEDAAARAERFVTAKTGRNIHTQVRDLPKLSELPSGSPHRPIVRYGYRSFDQQWTFEDPRLAKTESPSLWSSRSKKQIFLSSLLTTPLGQGPGLTVSSVVPDFHHFSGRGGKDVLPLYRDAEGEHPNLPAGLLDLLENKYGRSVVAEDIAAYVYALLAHPGYVELFKEELNIPGPRVPFTAKQELFTTAVDLGSRLLWLHTYAERFVDPHNDRPPTVPHIEGLHWNTPVTQIPLDPTDLHYDSTNAVLHVGDGTVTGVRQEVFEYSVSGFPVVVRWLGSRTAKGVGRAANPRYATPLDRIRPTVWEDSWNDELLDLLRVLTFTLDTQAEQSQLLEAILNDELIHADEFPVPTAIERKVPKS